MNNWFVYILKSKKNGKYYTGHTSDIQNRLDIHNGGNVRATKSGMPWKIIHFENFLTRKEAYKREM